MGEQETMLFNHTRLYIRFFQKKTIFLYLAFTAVSFKNNFSLVYFVFSLGSLNAYLLKNKTYCLK